MLRQVDFSKNFDTIKREMLWGTYGKGGVEHCAGQCPEHGLQWVRLVDRETDHLQAILRTQGQIHDHVCRVVIESILLDRGVVPEHYSHAAEQELYRKWREALRTYKAD